MIGVAVVLILLVLVFGFAVVIGDTGPTQIGSDGFLELSIFGARITATVPGTFVTGAVTMIILLLAILLLIAGIRRARGQRRRIKSLTESAQAAGTAKNDGLDGGDPGSGRQQRPRDDAGTTRSAVGGDGASHRSRRPPGRQLIERSAPGEPAAQILHSSTPCSDGQGVRV